MRGGKQSSITNYGNSHSSIVERLSLRALTVFDFLTVGRAKHMIPKPAGHAEIHIRVLMMNDVMGAQFPVSWILEIEMMMNVMKHPVENKSGRQRGEET